MGESHINFKQKKVLCVESPDPLTDGTQCLLGLLHCKYNSSRASAKAAKRCAPSEQAKGTVLTGSTLEENEKRCFSDLSPLPLSALLEAVQAPRSLQRKLWKKSNGLGVLRRSSESFPAALRPPPYTPEGWVGLPGVPG